MEKAPRHYHARFSHSSVRRQNTFGTWHGEPVFGLLAHGKGNGHEVFGPEIDVELGCLCGGAWPRGCVLAAKAEVIVALMSMVATGISGAVGSENTR